MRAIRIASLLIVLVLSTLLAGPVGAGPAVSDAPALGVAQILAPPGSPDDGASAAAARMPLAAAEAETLAQGDPLPDQRYPWIIPRTGADRADERSGRLLHVVYLVASDQPDDLFDQKGFIEDSMRSQNVWFKQQTGNQQWRLDTFTFTWDDPATPEVEEISVNAVDVTFIKSTRASGSLNSVGEVDDELIALGLNQPNKRYLSYVAANAGGVCGDAWYPLDQSTTPVDGKYSDIYLYSSSGCRARDFAPNATQPYFTETIAMQEMVHNDGMVPLAAPHDCLVSLLAFGHVCTGPLWATSLDPERFDVMYPFVGLPLNEKKLDEDHLDYYRHPFPIKDLEQGLYLETV